MQRPPFHLQPFTNTHNQHPNSSTISYQTMLSAILLLYTVKSNDFYNLIRFVSEPKNPFMA